MQIYGSHVSDHAQVPQSGHALSFHLGGGSSSLSRRPPSSSWSADPPCRACSSSSSFGNLHHHAWRFVFVFRSRWSFEGAGSAVVIFEVARTDFSSSSSHPRFFFFFFCLVVLEPGASPLCLSHCATRIFVVVVVVLASPPCEFYLYLRRTAIARDGTSPSA